MAEMILIKLAGVVMLDGKFIYRYDRKGPHCITFLGAVTELFHKNELEVFESRALVYRDFYAPRIIGTDSIRAQCYDFFLFSQHFLPGQSDLKIKWNKVKDEKQTK